MHALIVGGIQVGKSTLIQRVVGELGRPVFGFETKKEDALADEQGSPVYIYDAGKPHVQQADNLVGHCQYPPKVYQEAFNAYAGKLANPPEECVVVLDEIGFMESQAEEFCDAIMKLLDGSVPVIAAVKHNHTPFLEAVRNHPNCRCFAITQENRDALFGEVLDFMQAQIRRA